MLTTALTFVLGASAASWILSRMKMILIIGAAFIISNGISSVYWYLKGYNSAATQCKLSTVIRERDEARRDLKIAAQTGAILQTELSQRDARLAEADQRTAEYAAEVKRKQEALDEAERKLAQARPKGCPACPPARRCVVE